MTTRYYHTPPPPASARVRCPVCHEAVYSRAGIHPQCAVRQSDPPRPKGEPKGIPVERVDLPGIEPSAGPEAQAGLAAVLEGAAIEAEIEGGDRLPPVIAIAALLAEESGKIPGADHRDIKVRNPSAKAARVERPAASPVVPPTLLGASSPRRRNGPARRPI